MISPPPSKLLCTKKKQLDLYIRSCKKKRSFRGDDATLGHQFWRNDQSFIMTPLICHMSLEERSDVCMLPDQVEEVRVLGKGDRIGCKTRRRPRSVLVNGIIMELN